MDYGLLVRCQEATEKELSSSDVLARLRDALNDHLRGKGSWGYIVDYYGDCESGDVVFYVEGDTRKAPYSIAGGEGTAAVCTIDFEAAVDVVPRTVYEPEADEAEHMAAMESAVQESLYTEAPLYERFVSKAERDGAAADDFAGKGKSFPILKPEDVKAAVHAMGRAGTGNLGPSAIRNRIISIATRKGWAKYLPKAWQKAGQKEAAAEPKPAPLSLIESEQCQILGEISLSESSRTSYPVKLISPGAGSTAYYPAKVLEESAGKFGKGTLMFWNHPTRSEEAQRPEGDLNNLAAILTKDAVWKADGPQGPGLYSEAKVMADYAQRVEERAPHIGLSIRAGGTGTGRIVEGKPELKSIEFVESVDYVTKAGRGGLALAEAAKGAALLEEKGGAVDQATEAEVKRIVEAAVAQATSPLHERARRGDAIVIIHRALKTLNLNESQSGYIADTVLREAIPTKDGAIDEKALRDLTMAEAKRFGAALGTSGVRNIGTPIDPEASAEEHKRIQEAREREAKAETAVDDQFAGSLVALGLTEAQAKAAVKGRVN